jgi:hypothetical protein
LAEVDKFGAAWVSRHDELPAPAREFVSVMPYRPSARIAKKKMPRQIFSAILANIM